MMPPREELIALVRQAIIEEFAEYSDPDEGDFYSGALEAMTDLSDMADFCQNSAWDIAQFVRTVLGALGFTDIDFNPKWLNEHAYGWDT